MHLWPCVVIVFNVAWVRLHTYNDSSKIPHVSKVNDFKHCCRLHPWGLTGNGIDGFGTEIVGQTEGAPISDSSEACRGELSNLSEKCWNLSEWSFCGPIRALPWRAFEPMGTQDFCRAQGEAAAGCDALIGREMRDVISTQVYIHGATLSSLNLLDYATCIKQTVEKISL